MITITDEMWTLEYNTAQEGYPLHVNYLELTLQNNHRALMDGRVSTWQIIYIGTRDECRHIADGIEKALRNAGRL